MTASDLAALAAAVRAAIDGAEADLAAMPFFVRPLVKRGFASRTGRSFAAWRDALAVPALLRADDLARLEANFRTAPERARKGGAGASTEAMREIEARAAARAAAVRALIDALAG